MKFIFLASQSPRRRELLEQLGIRYELLLPDSQQEAEALEEVYQDEPPLEYVKRVTLDKLRAARGFHQKRQLPVAPILCSDTTVALEGQIFGKPADRTDALQMLQQLQGRTHQVLTAVTVGLPELKDSNSQLLVSQSEVILAPMTAEQIERYVDSGESMGKAGAYAIQGKMAAYIQHLSGSYSGVMGLPLYETATLLRGCDVL